MQRQQASKSSTTGTPLLEVSSLSWAPGGLPILEDVSFAVHPGEFIGVIGPNGAGKSSLLRCLYKINTPAQGSITLLGQDVLATSTRALAQRIAVVLQESPAEFGLTVYELVRMGLAPHKPLFSRDNNDDLQKLQHAVEAVDLSHKLHEPVNHLSGGEKQRAVIARAIVQQPELLIMDEPTNHLDVKYKVEILQLAQSLETTILASIHDLNLAAAFCDKLLLLDRGRIVAFGSPAEVLDTQLIQSVFGIESHIDEHPWHRGPRITFRLGTQADDGSR